MSITFPIPPIHATRYFKLAYTGSLIIKISHGTILMHCSATCYRALDCWEFVKTCQTLRNCNINCYAPDNSFVHFEFFRQVGDLGNIKLTV